MKLITLVSWAGVAVAGRLTERALSFVRDVENEYAFGPRNTDYDKRDCQEPVVIHTEYDATATRHWAKLEIDSASLLNLIPFYWTTIALGTPNQPFRMILDLDYGGAVVRSEQCLDYSCERGFNYSSKASSTFHDEQERFLLRLPAQFAYGNVSRDHMQLVALNITDVMFGAVDDFH